MKNSFALFGALVALDLLILLVGTSIAEHTDNARLSLSIMDFASNLIFISGCLLLLSLFVDLIFWLLERWASK